MTCPYNGVPLPSIELILDDNGPPSKIEFSLRSSKALIQYMLASRTAATEISDGGTT